MGPDAPGPSSALSDLPLSPDGRYYAVASGGRGGLVSMVRGIPDPARPAEPGRDSMLGAPVVLGPLPSDSFWPAANAAGLVWIQSGFRRFWSYQPDLAARIRQGTDQP